MKEEELLKFIERLYQVGARFDSAFVHATSNGGESLVNGDEYERLCDVLVEAEEMLGIK